MIVDASALCAILFREPERVAILDTITRARRSWISPLQVWETCVSLSGRMRVDKSDEVYLLMESLRIEVATIGLAETKLAVEAWSRYGKGRHPAGLNFGDCFAYALAKSRGAALLYKGDDFSKTDVRSVL